MNQNKALGIAYKAHIGQLDKGGSPYILHPVRVALHCQTEDEKIVALLHDVVEDTSITFEDLKTEGLDDRLLEALKCLTKEEGEDYKAFIERVSTNRLATKVKIQDRRKIFILERAVRFCYGLHEGCRNDRRIRIGGGQAATAKSFRGNSSSVRSNSSIRSRAERTQKRNATEGRASDGYYSLQERTPGPSASSHGCRRDKD